MALLGSLQVRMGLDAADFRRRFGSFQKDLKRGVGKFQRSLRGLTSVGSLGGSLTAGLGLKSLIQTASDFEAQMNGVRAVMGNLAASEFVELSNKAKELGKTTKFSAIESASAIEVLAKNGLKFDQILGGALDASLLLAASTGSEIPEAADLATDAMLIFGKKATDLGQVVNAVNGVMINSKFGFEDYRNALAAGGPAAVKAGKSLDEFNATIGATASFFASGETAGTAFKVFTDRLVNDTKAAEAAQKKLGISFFDSEGRMHSMTTIAGQLEKGLAGLSDEEAIKSLTDQFGTRGANFAVALARAGSAGIEAQKGLQAQADASKQAEIRMQGAAGAGKRLTSALEGLKLQIAEGGLLKSVTGLLEKGTQLAAWLGNLPEPVLNAGVAITAFVAAAGPLAFGLSSIAGIIPIITGALGGMKLALLSITGPVGLIVAGIAGATVLIVKNWESVKAAVMNVVNGIIGWFKKWANENKGLLEGIGKAWSALSAGFLKLAGAIMTKVGEFSIWVSEKLNWLLEPIGGLQGAFEIFGQVVSGIFTAIGLVVKTVFESIGVIFENMAAVLNGEKSLWEGFRDALVGVWESIERNFGEIFARIWEYLKTIPGKMLELGKEIIKGLADGIASMGDAAVNEVKNIGKRTIMGAKHIFGIKSPSRVFREIGGFIMRGLGLGIEGESKVATKAMSKAAQDVIAAGQMGLGGEPGANGLLAATGEQANETTSIFGDVFDNFDDRLSRSVLSGQEGFKNLGDSLISEVGQRALKGVFGNLLGSISGLIGGTGGSGIFGSILSGIGGLFGIPSFSGGGHTGNRPRTGGLDGQGGFLAMVHPRETIIDETRMTSRTGRGGAVTVHNSFNIAPGVTREELDVVMREAEIQRQREERRRYRDGVPGAAEFAL